jgi:hypothetical protein
MKEGALASGEPKADRKAPGRSATALVLLATIATIVVLGCGPSGNTTGGLVPVSGTDTMRRLEGQRGTLAH